MKIFITFSLCLYFSSDIIWAEDSAPEIPPQNLPADQSTFVEIRSKGMVYVDKTAFIEKILNLSRPLYGIFTRPPGFGKSTFIQMLYEFFSGNKHCFNDTYIAKRMPENWTKYPIISLNFSFVKPVNSIADIDTYEKDLEDKLWEIGKSYGLDYRSSYRVDFLIENLYTKYGQPVVVLVDDYDKAFKQVSVEDPHLSKLFQMTVFTFYDLLKSQRMYIKLVFIAGISRLFLSNDLTCRDLTFDKDFASALGFTLEEINSNYEPSLQRLATHYGVNVPEVILKLADWYYGYRFSLQDPKTKVLNPISVISSLRNLEIKNYCTRMENSELAIKRLQISKKDIEQFYYYGNGIKAYYMECSYSFEFSSNIPPVVLLYNYGYLTIKRYDEGSDHVILTYPNKEMENLIIQKLMDPSFEPSFAFAMNISLRIGDMHAFIEFLNKAAFRNYKLPEIPTTNQTNEFMATERILDTETTKT